MAGLCVATAIVAITTQVVVRAQNPALRWVKAAPFPVPEEELYGVSVNNKMYVIGGYGKTGEAAPAMMWEYDADLLLRRLPASAERRRRQRLGAG